MQEMERALIELVVRMQMLEQNRQTIEVARLRDEFAMAVLVGLLSDKQRHIDTNNKFFSLTADAYYIADLMLKQREVKNDK